MFPRRKMVPVREVVADIVFAEVRARCPVTDTGDIHACYRLIEYDRRLLDHVGGEFVVLKSQANPDIRIYQVAIRKRGVPITDLVPAHEK